MCEILHKADICNTEHQRIYYQHIWIMDKHLVVYVIHIIKDRHDRKLVHVTDEVVDALTYYGRWLNYYYFISFHGSQILKVPQTALVNVLQR